MKSIFMMTVTGPESLGIIKALAHTTHELEGEWVRSKVTRLGGQFSALIKVSIDDVNESLLKAAFAKDFAPLAFSYAPHMDEESAAKKQITLEVHCKDRAGLIKDINSLILNLDFAIEHMESHRFEVSEIGATVFTARLIISVPEGADPEGIAEEIETLSDDVRVTVM